MFEFFSTEAAYKMNNKGAHKNPSYFLSIMDIKALRTTTVWKFQPNPSILSFSKLYENSSSINIQVLLDITDLCFSHLKVPASTFYKPSPACLPRFMLSARVETISHVQVRRKERWKTVLYYSWNIHKLDRDGLHHLSCPTEQRLSGVEWWFSKSAGA